MTTTSISASHTPSSIGSSASVPDMNAARTHRPVRQNPSRLSLVAGPRPVSDFETQPRQGSFDGRQSLLGVSRSLTTQSSSLVSLQKTVENLMLQDNEVLRKVQASMRGISSLAKETTKLEVGRDATGATCINQYVVVKTLGRGSFGKVKLCLNTLDGQLYAVKMVNRSFIIKTLQKPQKGLRRRVPRNPSDKAVTGPSSSTALGATVSGTPTESQLVKGVSGSMDSFNAVRGPAVRPSMDESNPLDSVQREIAVLKKLDHPNVVKLYEVIDPPGASYMMLVMEYMERGPVMETKGQTGFASFPERVALDYFRQTCAGLDYLHYNNVVHGDLKPENLLVTAAGQLKIGDFGSARMMGDSSASSKVSGTPAFQPPEVVSGGNEDPVAADVWALGVCLYCFVFGRLPFTGSCVLDISNAIRNDEIKFPAEVRISTDLQTLFIQMLEKDPEKRITLEGIMQHPWTTEHCRSPLPCLKSLLQPPKVIEITRNEAQAAIDRSSLVSMIRARLKEKLFMPGEYLFHEGEEAHCVFMIMSGVVEIVTKLNNGVDTSAIDEMEEQSFSVDLDESFTLDCNQLVPAGLDVKDGKLHIDRQKAQELKKRMKNVLLGRQQDYVTEVKGPGQVIGEVSLDNSEIARHKCSARARDTVTVVKLTEESFLKALMQQYNEQGGGDEMELYSTRNVEDADSGGAGAGALPPTESMLTTIQDDNENVGSFC